MNKFSYSKIIRQNWEIVALMTGIAIVIALVISVTQPFQYKATSKLLIIQNQTAAFDAYTATKSAEKIGKNLVQVVSTTSFYNDVVAANPRLVQEFPTDQLKLRKAWQKDVITSVVPETGILEIEAYNVDKQIAADMVSTVAYVLITKGATYHGGGTAVSIKVIDDVIVGKYPVRPNLVLNLGFAAVLGYVLGSLFVLAAEARHLSQRQQQSLFAVEPQKELPESKQVNGLNLSPLMTEPELGSVNGWRIIEE